MEELKRKAELLLEQCESVVLTSIDENGFPRPVPMSKVKAEGITAIWFATGTYSEKTEHFRVNPKAGVCFQKEINSVVLTGGQDEQKVIPKQTPQVQKQNQKTSTVEKKEVEKNVTTSGKNDLFYAIQVASSKTQIKDLRYLKLKDKVEELKGTDRYRYYVKKTSSYEKALEFQQEVRKTVRDCFIIAVYKGKQITVVEARKLEQKK